MKNKNCTCKKIMTAARGHQPNCPILSDNPKKDLEVNKEIQDLLDFKWKLVKLYDAFESYVKKDDWIREKLSFENFIVWLHTDMAGD